MWRATFTAANRLVSGELERRWNDRLQNVRVLEEQLAQHDAQRAIVLSPEDQQRLLALGAHLSRAWDSAGASVKTRKKLLRLLIEEIVVDVVDEKVELVIHWHGGAHTRLSVKKKRVGQKLLGNRCRHRRSRAKPCSSVTRRIDHRGLEPFGQVDRPRQWLDEQSGLLAAAASRDCSLTEKVNVRTEVK